MFLYQDKNIGRGVWGTKSPKEINPKVTLSETLEKI